jgi:hypothetical protein
MDCNSVKERLVDFLYEELPAESRTAFEEHLRSCTACKAEVASYRSTLGSARSALSGRLAQEPPVRVRDAVMEAAKAAAQVRTGPRAASLREPKMGFFAKLWRTPWLMPAFGAASVATVVFLVRVLKNPEVIPGQRAGSIGEQAEPATAQPKAPPPPEQHPIANRELDTEGRAKAESPHDEQQPAGRFRGPRSKSVRDLARSKEEDRKGPAEHILGGRHLDQDEFASGADKAPAEARAPKKMDRRFEGPREEKAAQERLAAPSRFAEPPPPRAAESMGDGASVERSARSKDLSAPAGSATVLGAPVISNKASSAAAKRAEVPAPEPAKTASRGPSMAASALPAAAAPPPMVAPTPPPRPTPQKQAAAAREEEASYAPAAAMEEVAAEHKKGKAQSGPSLDETVRRADRLFADRRWNEAAEAYRELLRRYPAHSDAGKWRSRMDSAAIAARETDEVAKKSARAKAADSDTLQRAKP